MGTTNILDLNNRISALEKGGGGSSSKGIITRHLERQKTDGNGIIFLDLAVDNYVLVGVSTKDFSAGWGPLFMIGCWQESGTYKYMVKLYDVNGQPRASSNYEIDIHYMEKEEN